MKIIEKHPKFYTDYKDKTIIKNIFLKGTVIGYCVMYNKKNCINGRIRNDWI